MGAMIEQTITGHLILLMAPSGSGKARLVESLGGYIDDLYFLKTYTSRTKREGAEENPNYNFIEKKDFLSMIERGEFVEWAEFSGNYYGTPKKEVADALASGKIAFKEMELQGVEQMREIVPAEHMTVIYVDAGGWDALKQRILSRASISEEELTMRKLRYEEESKAMDKADIIIKNYDGELEEAQRNFRDVVAGIIKNVKS